MSLAVAMGVAYLNAVPVSGVLVSGSGNDDSSDPRIIPAADTSDVVPATPQKTPGSDGAKSESKPKPKESPYHKFAWKDKKAVNDSMASQIYHTAKKKEASISQKKKKIAPKSKTNKG